MPSNTSSRALRRTVTVGAFAVAFGLAGQSVAQADPPRGGARGGRGRAGPAGGALPLPSGRAGQSVAQPAPPWGGDRGGWDRGGNAAEAPAPAPAPAPA